MINETSNQSDNGTIEKYCYNNSESYCDIYGGLYQWDEMMDYTTQEGTQGICPDGWHIPTDDEWTVLTNYLGGIAIAGGKMKSTGTIEEGTGLWYDPNEGATNLSGFTGLPGGYRHYDGGFRNVGYFAIFWSSTETEYSSSAWYRSLYNDKYEVARYYYGKTNGFSVRCFQD